MEKFFEDCINIISIDLSYFDISDVTNISKMFNGCKRLKEIKGLHKFKTNKVEDMSGLFQLCSELKFLDLSNFDISDVINMKHMFSECKKLKEIKGLDKFNTLKVKDMSGIFQLCSELEILDLSGFDTSNVINMEYMFKECKILKEIKGLDKFNTKKVIDMNGMFQLCSELKVLDLSNFDTSNTINMKYMFSECTKLKEIKGLDKFNTEKVIKMNSLFN